MRHQILLKIFFDYNKDAQKNFQLAPKVGKGKSEPRSVESLAERTILRKGMVTEIEKEEKNIDNEFLKKYFTDYESPSSMYIKLRKTEGKINEDQVYGIKKVLDKMKKFIKKVPENKKNLRLKKTKR